MDLQPKSGITRKWASDPSLEFWENLTQHWDHQQKTNVCLYASSDLPTVIVCPHSSQKHSSKSIPAIQKLLLIQKHSSRADCFCNSNFGFANQPAGRTQEGWTDCYRLSAKNIHPKAFQLSKNFCPSENIPVVLTASATATSGSSTSPQERRNTRQATGPPRSGPTRLNGFVYTQQSSVACCWVLPQWKSSLSISSQCKAQDSTRSCGSGEPSRQFHWKPRSSGSADEASPVFWRFRTWPYETTNEIDKIKARFSELTNILDEPRTADRLLSAEVVTLEKKQPKRPKGSKVRNTGVNTDTVSASESCSTTCHHLGGFQSEFRCLRSKLLRESQNSKPKTL